MNLLPNEFGPNVLKSCFLHFAPGINPVIPDAAVYVEPVAEKMRPEIFVEMEIEILNGHHRTLFKRLIQKRPEL